MSYTNITDKNRQIRLNTVLGTDRLLPYRCTVSEGLSELFHIDLECFSEDPDIQLSDVLGHNLTVALDRPRGGTRFFNGFVTAFEFAGVQDRHYLYRAVASPWLWFLTQTENSRVFHSQTVVQIVRHILQEHGFSDFEMSLQGDYPEYVYCVQYGESDFAFVSRMLEREGIYYYFKHENGKHVMVFADNKSSHAAHPAYDSVEFMERDDHSTRSRECVFTLHPRQEVRPTNYVTRDYNYLTPRANMTSNSSIARDHALTGLEIYQYPGQYETVDRGTTHADARLAAFQSDHEITHGASTARGHCSGHTFALTGHPASRFNKKYMLTSVKHVLNSDDFNTGGDTDHEIYTCSFTAIDASVQFRPMRRTRRPVISGPQTAMVVGKKGEEIDADEHGRVLVSFHWEREGQPSRRVRVSHAWAGTEWGAFSVPRIGQEVIVQFENGDPDLPIITGRVYNGAAMPPYDASAMGTITTFKTNSSKGGGGFNELRFDDKKGEENIFIHAQYDMDIRTLNDVRETTLRDVHTTIGNDVFRAVGNDSHETIGSEYRLEVGQDIGVDAGSNIALRSGAASEIDAGSNLYGRAGREIVLDAGTGLTIKCGSSFVKVDPSGVTISGPMIRLNSGGSAGRASFSGPASPADPMAAQESEPGSVDSGGVGALSVSPKQLDSHPVAQALLGAAQSGAPFCEICVNE